MHVGEPGAGQVVKACNQVVVAVTIAAVSEALVLGSKAGVDPEKILDVLGGGLAANRVMEMRRRNFLEHDFTPGLPGRPAPQGPQHRARVGRRLRRAAAGHGLVQQYCARCAPRATAATTTPALLTVVEELAAPSIAAR